MCKFECPYLQLRSDEFAYMLSDSSSYVYEASDGGKYFERFDKSHVPRIFNMEVTVVKISPVNSLKKKTQSLEFVTNRL